MPTVERGTEVFELQPDATIDQASPVQNTWYTILDTILNVLVHAIWIKMNTTGETVAVRMTIDGIVKTASAGFGVDEDDWVTLNTATGELGYSAGADSASLKGPLPSRSFKMEVRKTTANGTGTLSGRVTHSQIP